MHVNVIVESGFNVSVGSPTLQEVIVSNIGIQGPPGPMGIARNSLISSGLFYPLTGNPSGFILPSQTGIFITTDQTGVFNSNVISNVVFTTGDQIISGNKTFSDIFTDNVYSKDNSSYIDISNNILIDNIISVPSLDWSNRLLTDQNSFNSLDWENKVLSGNWSMGALTFQVNAGIIKAFDLPILSGSLSSGQEQSYSFDINGLSICKIYSEYDGHSGIQNTRMGVNNDLPNYTLDVGGNIGCSGINVKTGISINGYSVLTNNFYRAGQIAVGNLSVSQIVSFSHSMSSTGYSVGLTFDRTLNSSISISTTLKTISGFTLTLSSGVSGGIIIDYIAFLFN